MVKKICLIMIACLLLPGMTSQENPARECRSYVIEPWSAPIEVAYIVPMDGSKIIMVTSNEKNAIHWIPSIEGVLALHGLKIPDIFVLIHNHLTPEGVFSKDDIIVYWYLKANGFTGAYMLRTPRGLFVYAPDVGKE